MAEIIDITAALRRTLLRALPLALTGAVVIRSGEAAPHPDAGLIALCTAYRRAVDTYNEIGGELDYDVCPFWRVVDSLRGQIAMAAPPATMDGIAALARVAQQAARKPSGEMDYDTSFTGEFPARVIEGVIRLAGAEPLA